MTTLIGAYLYRAYDEAGRLIYLGISLAAFRRLAAHENSSGWWREARMITITPYSNQAEAARAEVEAIRNEKPLYNQIHAVEKPVAVPVASAHQGKELLRRLKAGKLVGGVEESRFKDRVAAALAVIRQVSEEENHE